MNDLRNFVCRRCGNCCRWHGYVRLTEKEADSIASFLGMNVRDFNEKYTRLTNDRLNLSLNESPDGRCVFLTDDSTCAINPVKPGQCKAFPFTWNFDGWAEFCDGMRFLKR